MWQNLSASLRNHYNKKAQNIVDSARECNEIEVDAQRCIITKRGVGTHSKAVEAEKSWYSFISEEQSIFVPRILSSPNYGELRMAWEEGINVAQLWLASAPEIRKKIQDQSPPDQLTLQNFQDMVNRLLEIADLFHIRVTPSPYQYASTFNMFIQKPLTRLAPFEKDFKFVTQPELERIRQLIVLTGIHCIRSPFPVDAVHGDFHLGNMLFQSTCGRFILLDPRGNFGVSPRAEGDARYDFAKLYQSFYCSYDQLVNNYFHFEEETRNLMVIEHPFRDGVLSTLDDLLEDRGHDPHLVRGLSIVLLVTAIPFHGNNLDRQEAMWKKSVQLLNALDPWIQQNNDFLKFSKNKQTDMFEDKLLPLFLAHPAHQIAFLPLLHEIANSGFRESQNSMLHGILQLLKEENSEFNHRGDSCHLDKVLMAAKNDLTFPKIDEFSLPCADNAGMKNLLTLQLFFHL